MNKHKIIGGFISAFALLSGLLYFVLYTATGLSWYINHAIAELPGNVQLQRVHHTLKGNCEITGFHYQSDKVAIYIDMVNLNWNPLAIFSDQLNINRIVAKDVELHFFQPYKNPESTSLQQGTFPLVANIEHGSVENLTIRNVDNSTYRIKSTNFNQLYFDETVFVDKMIVQDSKGNSLEVSGEAGLRSSDIINLTTQAAMRIPGTDLNIRSHGTVVGSITQLRFLQRFTAPYNIKLEGRVKNLLLNPYWHFDIAINKPVAMTLPKNWHIKTIQGKLTGEGNNSKIDMAGSIQIADASNNQWDAAITSQWDAPGAKFSFHAKRPALTDVELALNGEWAFHKDTEFLHTLSVNGHWQNIKWSMDNGSLITSKNGLFNFDGAGFRTNINASDVAIDATGTYIKTLSITTSPGKQQEIELKGKARTDSGQLSFTGSFQRTNSGYHFKTISLTGRHFDLINKPKSHIVISPDIRLSSRNKALHSTGNILITKANIQLQKIGATYRLIETLLPGSSDLTDSRKGYLIDKVNVRLGDGVWMHGFGLNAQVTGDLALVNLFNNSMLADGELNVSHGNYKRDNRHYSVTGGKIKFNQQSLDNPEVAINIAGGNLPHNNTDIIKGLLQKLYKEQNAGKLALNP